MLKMENLEKTLKRSALVVGGLALTTTAVVIARTLLAAARARPVRTRPEDDLHDVFLARKDAIAAHLAEAIRFQTISYDRPESGHAKAACAHFNDEAVNAAVIKPSAPAAADDEKTRALRAQSEGALRSMHAYLATTYPRMHAAMKRTVVNELSLAYVWRGTDPSLQATALYSHMDVVPVDDAASWSHPSFSGAIVDGYVWGRGAIDDKQGVIGTCEALEHLCAAGFRPRRTLVVLFGHDEEIGGREGAAHLAVWVARNIQVTRGGVRVKPVAFLLDEGLFVLEGLVPGVRPRTALVCTAEKGMVSVRLDVEVVGGHSSVPRAESSIGILARAVSRLQATPFPSSLHGPAASMFEHLLPYMRAPTNVLFANLWLFQGLILRLFSGIPATAAIVRTTTALTLFHAGSKHNTLPAAASAVVNHRILPRESVASVLARDKRVVADPRVTLTPLLAAEPSPESDPGAPGFAIIARSVERLFPNTVVAPALMVGGTDSPWYVGVAENMYRHCPTELHATETAMFHGRNERMGVDNMARIAAFYARVILDADASTQF